VGQAHSRGVRGRSRDGRGAEGARRRLRAGLPPGPSDTCLAGAAIRNCRLQGEPVLLAVVALTWLAFAAFVLALCRASARAERHGAASRPEQLESLSGDNMASVTVWDSAEAPPASHRAGMARGHRPPGVL